MFTIESPTTTQLTYCKYFFFSICNLVVSSLRKTYLHKSYSFSDKVTVEFHDKCLFMTNFGLCVCIYYHAPKIYHFFLLLSEGSE